MALIATPLGSEAQPAQVAAADRWLVLAVLTLLYALNVADRFIASTLMEPIKAEFALSDSMVGFLTGTVLSECPAVQM